MHLINIQRPIRTNRPALHPLLIVKPIRPQIPDNRTAGRPYLHAEPIRIRMIPGLPVRPPNPVFIPLPFLCLRAKTFKCPVNPAPVHLRFLPVVALPGERCPAGIRGKHPKANPCFLSLLIPAYMGSEIFIGIKHIPLKEIICCHVFPSSSSSFPYFFQNIYLSSHRFYLSSILRQSRQNGND